MTAAADGFAAGPFGRLHYLEQGSGAPLVLLHGAGASAYEFEHVIGPLAGDLRVIAWDMPGHGDSDGLPRHLTIEDYADALAALIAGLGLGASHVAGTSAGGLIVAALAARHPAAVASVALVETPVRSAAAWRAMWPLVETMFATPTQAFEQVAPRFRDLSGDDFARWNIDRNKAGGKAMMSAMWAIREHQPDLRAIAAPTLLIRGERGAVADGIAETRAALPEAKEVTMAGCGHFPMIDDPAAFADIVGGFVRAQAPAGA